MNRLSELIWQRGSAREIMQEVRMGFRARFDANPSAAHVEVASVHYSLAKRYMSWWQLPLVLWHLRQAVANVVNAMVLDDNPLERLTPEQIDVVTTIFAKVPRWLGGDRVLATSMIMDVLYIDTLAHQMKPHTRALMLITLAELEWALGDMRNTKNHYDEARRLIPIIQTEDSDDRDYQLIRVLRKIGFFYYEYGDVKVQSEGHQMISQARCLANDLSKDQMGKIEADAVRCGYQPKA